jgi:hypothetical protein
MKTFTAVFAEMLNMSKAVTWHKIEIQFSSEGQCQERDKMNEGTFEVHRYEIFVKQ